MVLPEPLARVLQPKKSSAPRCGCAVGPRRWTFVVSWNTRVVTLSLFVALFFWFNVGAGDGKDGGIGDEEDSWV